MAIYCKEIEDRLAFIRFLHETAYKKIELKNLTLLWEALVVNAISEVTFHILQHLFIYYYFYYLNI